MYMHIPQVELNINNKYKKRMGIKSEFIFKVRILYSFKNLSIKMNILTFYIN